MKNLFFVIRKRFSRLVLQTDSKQHRLTLVIFQREKFVNKQLSENTTELSLSNIFSKIPQLGGFFLRMYIKRDLTYIYIIVSFDFIPFLFIIRYKNLKYTWKYLHFSKKNDRVEG